MLMEEMVDYSELLSAITTCYSYVCPLREVPLQGNLYHTLIGLINQ